MEAMGYILWEGATLLFVLFGGIGLTILRRKTNGRPAFTDEDRLLYFGDLDVGLSMPKLCLKLCVAAFLCSLIGSLEALVLPYVGPGLFSAAFLLTSLGIVKSTLS